MEMYLYLVVLLVVVVIFIVTVAAAAPAVALVCQMSKQLESVRSIQRVGLGFNWLQFIGVKSKRQQI